MLFNQSVHVRVAQFLCLDKTLARFLLLFHLQLCNSHKPIGFGIFRINSQSILQHFQASSLRPTRILTTASSCTVGQVFRTQLNSLLHIIQCTLELFGLQGSLLTIIIEHIIHLAVYRFIISIVIKHGGTRLIRVHAGLGTFQQVRGRLLPCMVR